MRGIGSIIWATGSCLLATGLLLSGCSNDDNGSSGPATTATAPTTTAPGGAGGTGGTGAGGGPAVVPSGTAGGGGAAATCPPGDPPISEHNSCNDIPSANVGDDSFTISSPDFTFCGEIPESETCDGNAFGTGSSPTLEWSGAPEGTMSYALVFKDIAILADGDPATERFGYHWVMWDIPPDTAGLPPGMTGGYESSEVPGALQWASRNDNAWFPPCPNPFPAGDDRFSCELSIDSYSFTLYALPTAKLEGLPAADIDPDTGMPTGNWVVNMGHYIESQDALAVTEYRGTSGAWATSFAPPDPVQYPCTQAEIDAGTTDACLLPSAGCPAGPPPLMDHNSCSDIPTESVGDGTFTVSSPDFDFCGPIPDSMTCDGNEFGTGTSPELEWSGAPDGTMSYALVFKDIAILADDDPTTERFGYHWVMWDIPPDVMGLPAGMTGGYDSAEVPGALQWASRNNYGWFPPCPNPFPADDDRFSCSLVNDSYSFTLYALPTAKLEGLPAADVDPDTGMPTGNWVVNMGHYIESQDALAVAEYRGTSDAWASSFNPPDPVEYPCSDAPAETAADAGTPECLMSGAAGCPPGDPPISEHNSCTDIPSVNAGSEGFMISSPDFDYCGEIPASMTCDGNEFGTGSSPALEWSGAPTGTMSYALVFKDIAILADGDPSQDRFGYHWVMWDIPPDTAGLPAAMTGGYASAEVPGAKQWASRNDNAWFPPCPNPFPADDDRFSCNLVIDSYSFTLYALPVATLTDLPAADLDPDTGMPTGNWVVNMGHYIESLDALAVTEYRGTSGAWATSFMPPDPAPYPCTTVPALDGGALDCLQ